MNYKEKIKTIIKNPNFWIILFFIIRLYHITEPPLEKAHNWRQVTTNMYARNFLEVDANIMYSRVDMAGELSGITAKEFPLFNYLIFLIAKVFGFQHWYGRLINLIFSTIGIFYFKKIIEKYINPDVALYATLALLCSIWFSYSRKILPDSFSTALTIAGLYYGLVYLYEGKFYRLILYFIFTIAGVLSKIPSLYLLGILAIPVFQKKVDWKKKTGVIAFGFLVIAANIFWYFYWIPYVVKTYEYTHYPIEQISEGAKEILSNLSKTSMQFIFVAFFSFTAFALFLYGFIVAILKKQKLLLAILCISSLLFLVFIFKAGFSFYQHTYYIIPFVPVMALLAGYGISQIKITWLRIIAILAIMIEGIANQQNDFRPDPKEYYKLNLEIIADSVSNKTDLIVINGTENPQELYFTHRKGWTRKSIYLLKPLNVQYLRDRGCKYAFYNKNNDTFLPDWKFPIVYEDKNYIVYDLRTIESVSP